MGFGNGAFQAAKIAIDGVTIIENITTGKVQTGPSVTVGITAINESTLSIPIYNNQGIDTPKPFQQFIQLNLSQYPQLKDISSDLSNVYFSSDEAGQNKLYSWRETPASLTSDVTWWVLLPNGIPASGTAIIYLQVSSSTALDGVYTGEAPQLSSNYAQYDNGANVFNNYWNFAGTSLPPSLTVLNNAGSAGSYTVNNSLTLSISNGSSNTNIGVYSGSLTNAQVIEADIVSATSDPAYTDILVGSIQSTDGTLNQWGVNIGYVATLQNGGWLSKAVSSIRTDISAIFSSPYLAQTLPQILTLEFPRTGIQNELINYISYASAVDASITYNPTGELAYLSIGVNNNQIASAYVEYQWLRTRAYPPNGVMPALEVQIAQVAQSFITSTQNNWAKPQTFLAGLVDVNPTYMYVTNYSSNAVSVINTSTNTIVNTITVGTRPYGIAITPNGLYAYVTNYGSANVSVINTTTNTVVSTITVGTSPEGIAITPNGLYVYVTHGSGTVSVINTTTNTVVSTITVGTSPFGIAITPNGLYAYVANSSSNTVSVINTATNTVVDTISVGSNSFDITITPNGRYAYIPYLGGSSVLVIDTSTNTVVDTISVGTSPYGIAITPNGLYVYVTNIGSSNVSVIDTATNTVINTISIGGSPYDIAITPNGLYAYVTNRSSNTVSVINTATNTVVDTISVGSNSFIVASTPYFYTATGIAPYLSGFQQNTATPQTTLAGSTAGSITYSMPTVEGAYKKFVAYANGYENDTTTAQTISFPVAFVNTPYVATAPSGLISSTTTTGITLASGTTTTYTGWVIIEGY